MFSVLLTIYASMSGVVILLCTVRLISLRSRRNIGSSVLGHLALFELHVPNLAIACTFSPQVSCPFTSAFLLTTVSVSNVHVCKLAQSAVYGHENQIKPTGMHSVVHSHLPVVCTSLASNHVILFQQLMPILSQFFAPISNTAACLSDPRKRCIYFSIGIHKQNNSAPVRDLTDNSIQLSPEFHSKSLRCRCFVLSHHVPAHTR